MAAEPVAGALELPALRRTSSGRALTVGVAERRAILLLGDLAALLLSLALTALYVPKPTWLFTFTTPERVVTPESVVVLALLWLLASILADCYDLTLARSKYYGPLRAAGVAFLVHVAYPLIPIVAPPMLKSTFVWAALAGISVVATALWRTLYATVVSRHPIMTMRTVIVGDGNSGRLIAETLQANPGSGYVPVAFVSERRAHVGTKLAGLPVTGSLDDLAQVIEGAAAKEVVVATDGPVGSDAYGALTLAYESGVRVTPMVSLYERVTSQTPVQHVGEHWLAVMPQPGEGSAVNAFVKRGLDVLGGLVGLIVLALLATPIALAIRLDSHGPVLFSQDRVGRGGRAFRIYKFRTLPLAQAPELSIWERKVTRPTRVGRWLRRLRLDELPQFWNVLIGDMSLVGPRPFVPADVEELQRHIPFFRARHLVRPGLTGWAQIKAPYGTTLEDELAKLQYDLYYIRHQSLAFDLAILIKTIVVLLRLAGR